jgi:hypothetical protein
MRPLEPGGPAVQMNNFTAVPIERLTDEGLDFYLKLAEQASPVIRRDQVSAGGGPWMLVD